MPYVKEVDLSEVIVKLPEIIPFQIERVFSIDDKDDLFLCALGFEDRAIHIPRMLAESRSYNCNQVIYFEYLTNVEDNSINKAELMQSLQSFSQESVSMQCDADEFTSFFRQKILALCQKSDQPNVTFDISACSSKLLLQTIKILLNSNVKLRIVYSEAAIYYPTLDEISKNNVSDKKLYLTEGAGHVHPSTEYAGFNVDALPEAVIAFATFNPDRTRVVISYIDENLLGKTDDRVTWVIGVPHLEENQWRIQYLMKINNLPSDSHIYPVSTFDYIDTITCLHKLYERYSMRYHLNISPLGSKMQSIGIALYHYMKPELSIMYAPPNKYRAENYSEGCRDVWMIDFGPLNEIKDLLDEVGIIKIVY